MRKQTPKAALLMAAQSRPDRCTYRRSDSSPGSRQGEVLPLSPAAHGSAHWLHACWPSCWHGAARDVPPAGMPEQHFVPRMLGIISRGLARLRLPPRPLPPPPPERCSPGQHYCYPSSPLGGCLVHCGRICSITTSAWNSRRRCSLLRCPSISAASSTAATIASTSLSSAEAPPCNCCRHCRRGATAGWRPLPLPQLLLTSAAAWSGGCWDKCRAAPQVSPQPITSAASSAEAASQPPSAASSAAAPPG